MSLQPLSNLSNNLRNIIDLFLPFFLFFLHLQFLILSFCASYPLEIHYTNIEGMYPVLRNVALD